MKAIAVVDVNLLVRGTLSTKGGSYALILAFKRSEYLLVSSRRHLT